MKLRKHHVEWLNRNDGDYTVEPDRCKFERDGVKFTNVIRFVFRNTAFTFNERGLAQAIDSAIDLYPDS